MEIFLSSLDSQLALVVWSRSLGKFTSEEVKLYEMVEYWTLQM